MVRVRPLSPVALLGPSGAGKTTVARALRDKRGWLWIEADQFPQGDGIQIHRLVEPWGAFLRGDPWPLRNALRRRAKVNSCQGAILSATSMVTLPEENLKKAAAAGLQVVVLFGSKENCLAAFLKREERLKRDLGEAHWRHYNEPFYRYFEAPEIEPFRIAAFTTTGHHRTRKQLVEGIVARTGVDD